MSTTDKVNLETGDVEIAIFSQTDAGLAALREKYGEVPDATTKEGYELAKAGAKELTTLRTSIEKARKEVKQPYLDAGKAIDAEARRITAELLKLEEPIKAAKKNVDDAEKRKKEERIARLQAKIDMEITGSIDRAKMRTSGVIADIIAEVDGIDTLNDFYDLTSEATEARDVTLSTLNGMYNERLQFEISENERLELEEENKRLENERAVETRINSLKMIPMEFMGKSSKEIAKKIEQLDNFEIDRDEFGDRYDEAVQAAAQVVVQLAHAKAGAEALESQKAEEKADNEEKRKKGATNPVDPQQAAATPISVEPRHDEEEQISGPEPATLSPELVAWCDKYRVSKPARAALLAILNKQSGEVAA